MSATTPRNTEHTYILGPLLSDKHHLRVTPVPNRLRDEKLDRYNPRTNLSRPPIPKREYNHYSNQYRTPSHTQSRPLLPA
jgi:hypothetical protein